MEKSTFSGTLMPKLLSFLLISLSLIIITGCAVVEDLLPSGTPPDSGTILYADDFSKPRGWGTIGRSGEAFSLSMKA